MVKQVVFDDNVPTISPTAARLAIGAAVAALLFLASLHVLSPEFNPAWRMVSEYANGRYSWILSLMFACWGLSSFALACAIRSQARTAPARVGLILLVIAGIGEAMAAIFDLNHVVLHNVAGLLGMGGLPIAALLISVSLSRIRAWSASRRTLLLTANLTWLSVVLLVAAFVLMVTTFMATGAPTPAQAPKVLPPGVIGVVGWANRLLVLSYCVWVIAVAREAIKVSGQEAVRRHVDRIPAVRASEI